MGNRNCNQKDRKHPNTKQNTETYKRRETLVRARAKNLVELIGADRVSRREYQYDGTYYVTEDGEVYDKEYVTSKKAQRTGVSFYETVDWEYNYGKTKKMYYPTVRRIVMIKNTNNQLSLNL